MMRRALGLGLVTGLLLTLPLTAVQWLASRVLGLAFPPYALFETAVRILPGGLVTTGLDAMVATLELLQLSLRSTAKTAEQGLAVFLFLVGGSVAGGILFLVWRWRDLGRARHLAGLLSGVIVGISAVLLTSRDGLEAANVAWIIALSIAWGWLLHAAFRRLISRGDHARRDAEIERLDRRRFLIRLGGVSAAITVVGAGLALTLPGGRRRTSAGGDGEIAGSGRVTPPDRPGALEPAPGTRAEYPPVEDHYRIDINLTPPRIEDDEWRLPVSGLVEEPTVLTVDDFYRGRLGDPQHLFVTLSCISNPIAGDLVGTTRWTGIPVHRVLDRLRVHDRARYLFVTSADGFYETVPLELIRSDHRIMLAYLWDGRPLTPEHGFPLRLFIPDRYGMKQPKWITRLELLDEYQEGYWVERGWDRLARVKATSVIDTVAVDDLIEDGSQRLVPIGGIAYSGARGISRVQVQVDGGNWRDAHLRAPISQLTWVIWRYDWPFQRGGHTFTVRCLDGAGEPQIVTPSDPHPSGASGLHEVSEHL